MGQKATNTLSAVTLLGLVFSAGVHSQEGRPRICSRMEALQHETSESPNSTDPTGSQPTEQTRMILECHDPNSLVMVETEKVGKGFRASVVACPNVRRVFLYVTSPGFFKREAANKRTVSCERTQDTLVIYHPGRRQRVTIATGSPTNGDVPSLKLSWTYQYISASNTTKWVNYEGSLDIWSKTLNSTMSSQVPIPRMKRSRPEDKDTVQIHMPRVCGKDQSCIRFGRQNCAHLECDYLLTYTVTNHSLLELEISGKTMGWVAVGMSSDDKMGGDGVIVCKRKSFQGKELQALTMWINLAHTRPKPKPNEYTLVAHNSTDGFIYCKMTGSILNQKKNLDSDTYLDLSNNWYQLYAKGDVDRNGLMLQHHERPPASRTTITMLRHTNIYSSEYKQLKDSAPSLTGAPPNAFVLFVLTNFISFYMY
ncbi:unnamed protein product [Lymnaea stagnalis]|uniref:DOMON domain-containing protein n=1 Tax=Lymnaea stagnalis TaxID=6523 RepID=A0AAV2H1S3_LYMST